MTEKSKARVFIWLISGCVLIFLMVVVGGITRLTGSGLSITEWNIIMGAIPPMNDQEWHVVFDKYKEIPQYKIINKHFELDDFKSIFWWEYIHRLLGRLIGFVFIIPFIFFIVTKQLSKSMVRKALFLFLLGGLQGFLGWYMVSSGLTERTSVSHIRLAIHLLMAFITFGFTFWYALELRISETETKIDKSKRGIFRSIFSLLLIQIIYGAFVAGMYAGKMYNTFPLMDGQVIPSGIAAHTPLWTNLFYNPVTVQFIHRLFAWILLIFILKIWWDCRRNGMSPSQRRALNYVLIIVAVQFLLGVLTLLTKVDMLMASLHQAGALFFFAAMIYLLFLYRSPRIIGVELQNS